MRLVLRLHEAWRHNHPELGGPSNGKPQRPWVARLTGLDDKYTFAREFVRGEYAAYNPRTQPARFYGGPIPIPSFTPRYRDTVYDLGPGLYEVNAPTAYDQADRYFAVVDPDGTLRRVRRDEAILLAADAATPTPAELAALLTDEDHERH